MTDLLPAVILCSETQERFMGSAQRFSETILHHYNTTLHYLMFQKVHVLL